MAWHGMVSTYVPSSMRFWQARGCEFGRSRRGFGLSATTSPWLRAVGLRILQEARGRPVRADLTFVNDNDGVRGFDVRCRAGGHWLGDGSTPPHAVAAAAAASFFHSDGFAGRLAGWRAAQVGCRARRPLAEEEGCCERMGRSRRDSFRTTHATCWILVARDGVVAVVLIGGGERGCLPDLVPVEVFWDVGDLVPLICRCFVL